MGGRSLAVVDVVLSIMSARIRLMGVRLRDGAFDTVRASRPEREVSDVSESDEVEEELLDSTPAPSEGPSPGYPLVWSKSL